MPTVSSPNDFNNHFLSISNVVASEIPDSTILPTSYLQSKGDMPSLSFDHVTECDIGKIIMKLNPQKAVGHDGISGQFIHKFSPFLCAPITAIINTEEL